MIDNTETYNIDEQTLLELSDKYGIGLPLQKKRGRKSKHDIEIINKMKHDGLSASIIYGEEILETPKLKKRGRKPKGGKITSINIFNSNENHTKSNVILHLKCSTNDILTDPKEPYEMSVSTISTENNLSYSKFDKVDDNLKYRDDPDEPEDEWSDTLSIKSQTDDIQDKPIPSDNNEHCSSCACTSKRIINYKLHNLQKSFHVGFNCGKNSCCFYCTETFDNPTIYIPKSNNNGMYSVYGCFCTPECAAGYLMQEQLDSSIKYERFFLLNNLYSSIYEYTQNIKPSPDPHYTLSKFYGNLNIDEYRNLCKIKRMFIIIDKPITRVTPELHEDNEDLIFNSHTNPSQTIHHKKNMFEK